MKHKGSCHCGKVAFEVEGEVTEAMACNCSICSRRGSLLWFVARDKLHLLTQEDASTYMFNKHVIKHRFCANCGIHTFGEGSDAKGNHMAAVNIRCIDNFDFSSVPVKLFDGRSTSTRLIEEIKNAEIKITKQVSLDGFVARPNGQLDWMISGQLHGEVVNLVNELIDSSDRI